MTNTLDLGTYLLGAQGLKVTIGLDLESTIYLTLGLLVAMVLALVIFGIFFT